MLILWYLSGVPSPVIAGYHANIVRGKQRLQFTARFTGSRTKSVGHYAPGFRVVCIPEPVLPGFIADKDPLLIQLADKSHVGMSDRR